MSTRLGTRLGGNPATRGGGTTGASRRSAPRMKLRRKGRVREGLWGGRRVRVVVVGASGGGGHWQGGGEWRSRRGCRVGVCGVKIDS